jgi:chemotaxis protein methyltransferase CheR/type IV pilus assembly protein PilK
MSTWSYQAPPELSDEQYARWQTLLEERTGICFLQHKSIMQKGLSQRMREVGVDDYEQYFQQISAVPEGAVEWMRLVDRISVKETSFYREPHSYQVLRSYLLKRVDHNVGADNAFLDLWSVGCSTGEEAYSLAMTANDAIDFLGADVFLGVMATDISQSALAAARQGRYASRKLSGLPLAITQKYFVRRSEQEFEVVDRLRQRMNFVQGNLLNLAALPKMDMDVIFCQNVLVYFRRERQRQVLDNLVRHLKPGGMLIVGPGEVVGWRHTQMQRTADEYVQAYIRQ